MSRIDYAWMDRQFNTYMAQFSRDELPYYLKQVEEHRSNEWRGRDHVIVAMKPRVIGFKLRVIWGWPRETSWWPKVRRYTGFEMLGMLWQVSSETHEFIDTVYFDPLGEWPKGTKIDDILKKIKAKKKETARD